MGKRRTNDQIRVPKVRVILDGRNLGIVSTNDAKNLAKSKNLDLVEVSPNVDPPVCQIIDYGKYEYNQKKKKRKDTNKNKKVDWKEIRLTAGTANHDIETKVKQLRGFLESGKHVKISVRHFKRQIAHKDQGQQVMDAIINAISDIGKVQQKPRLEGRNLTTQIVPK